MPSPGDTQVSTGIPPGTLVGGRFSIERHVGTDTLGELLLARDQKTTKPIGVRLLSPAFASDPIAFETIRAEVRAAAKLKHRSIASTYGIGTHGEQHFVACEWVQGSPLSDLAAKRQGAAPLSLRGIYNVIAHVCKALEQVHAGERPGACYGALRPSAVWIAKSGRVKLVDVGLSAALVQTGGFRLLDPAEQVFLAPEVHAGEGATPRSDVYGVGALLYSLLTGRPPSAPLVRPSEVHPDAMPELDALVLACLTPDPRARVGRVADITNTLMPLLSETSAGQPDEFGVDMEIDVDVAMSLAPPAPARAGANRPNAEATSRVGRDPFATRAAPPVAPEAPAREARRTTPDAAVAAVAAAPPKTPPAPKVVPAEERISAAMAKLTENDAPRWMAVKNGLDHGPFTARELIKLIVDGEILEAHGLLNMSSGDRKPLAEWTEFHEFVEQYKLRKDEADHALALQKSTRIERTSNAAKFVILGGSLALLVLAGGGYLMSRRAAEKRAAQHEVDVAAMFESGRVKISGTAGILVAPPRRAGGGGGAHRSSGGDGSGFTSYEDAMNQAMDLGDATKGGSERQLRTADIEAVMNRKLNTLFGCVGQELRSGGRLGTVQIDMAIMGSGQVAGASVNAGSAAFRKCMAAKMRQISFPSFPAARMGARYSFGVN
jgi:serine/threonine protein kinase